MDRLPQIKNNWLYVEAHKWPAYKFISIYHAITETDDFGDYAQFGVFQGLTARFITRFLPPERRLHLFDSFEGLPEDWVSTVPKGAFNVGGKVPKVDLSVCNIYKGWFSNTVGPFAETHGRPLSFLHLDADLYSSTMDVLRGLNQLIVPGTILLFDEYIFQGKEHEHEALLDWSKEFGRTFEYLWRSENIQVAVRVVD